VYALIETGDGVPMDGKPTQSGQLWRSDDGGENWKLINSDRQIRGRTHYYTREEVSPDNENEVYFFTSAFSRTLDGGHTLTNMPSSPGGDNHEMWIDPTNGDRMAVVNDGGVSISVNRGHTWDRIQLPIAQIYHVTLDDQIPYFVYGNKQDGPSYRGPSNSLQFGGFGGAQISRSVWHPVAGSESGFATPDPVDNSIIWSTGTVFAIAESPKEAGVIWAGTNDGYVQITRDGGKNWTNVTKNIPNLPEWGTVSNIEASRYDAGAAYITVDFHQMNNRDPFAYKTADYGKTWTQITNGIPHSMLSYAHCIREDPVRKGQLYLGTENGLYISFDDGKNWQPLQSV